MELCPKCGLPYEDDEITCINCGYAFQRKTGTTPRMQRAEDLRYSNNQASSMQRRSAISLQNEGRLTSQSPSYRREVQKSVGREELKNVANAVQKTANAVSKGVQQVSENVPKTISKTIADMEIASKPNTAAHTEWITPNYKNTTSNTEMWSWLKQDSKRMQFYNDVSGAVDEATFMDAVVDRMEKTGVPATIVKRKIKWDNGMLDDYGYYVQPSTDVEVPVTCRVRLAHLGRFSYVEEKTFLMPPKLPNIPEKPKPVDTMKFTTGLVSAVLGVFAFMTSRYDSEPSMLGFMCLFVTLVTWFVYFASKSENKSYLEACRAWDKAWQNWEDTVLNHAFLENVDGQASRIFESVYTCIKMVSGEMLGAKKVSEQIETVKPNEIEAMVAMKKQRTR